jgi:hypothetical protein
MSYRFPVDAHERVVKDLWMDIVEGKSGLWDGIGEDKKECIRGGFPSAGGDTYRRADEQPSWFTSRHSRYVAPISDSHTAISAWETVS